MFSTYMFVCLYYFSIPIQKTSEILLLNGDEKGSEKKKNKQVNSLTYQVIEGQTKYASNFHV